MLYYIKKTVVAGATIEVEKTRSARIGRKIPRGENVNETPKDVEANNLKNAARKLTWLLNANFHPGDLHVILTYSNEYLPQTTQEAKTRLEKFQKDMRRFYEARDEKFDYIAVTEYQSRRIHHHLVIRAAELKILTGFWPWGRIRISLLDDKKDYSKLAEYLVKETDRTFPERPKHL